VLETSTADGRRRARWPPLDTLHAWLPFYPPSPPFVSLSVFPSSASIFIAHPFSTFPSFSGLNTLASPSTDIGQEESEAMTSLAMQLYGLIHARYILTTHGLAAMHHKYLHGGFGKCPRHLCAQQNVVPVSKVVPVRKLSVLNPVFFRKQQRCGLPLIIFFRLFFLLNYVCWN
jgi:hypothetical protein